MQRLPPHRIQRAQELGQIGLEENPAAAGFGTGDQAALHPGADFFGVHAQERGGLVEVERSFGDSLRAGHEQWVLTVRDSGRRCISNPNDPPAADAGFDVIGRTGFRFARGCIGRARPIVAHACTFGSRAVAACARYKPRHIQAEGSFGGRSSRPGVVCLLRGNSGGRHRRRSTRGRRFATSRSSGRESAALEESTRAASALRAPIDGAASAAPRHGRLGALGRREISH